MFALGRTIGVYRTEEEGSKPKNENVAPDVRRKLELPRETDRLSLEERISFFGSTLLTAADLTPAR